MGTRKKVQNQDQNQVEKKSTGKIACATKTSLAQRFYGAGQLWSDSEY